MEYIYIEDIAIHGSHGVFKEENILGQRFIISARLGGSLQEAMESDDVEKTVNYALVCDLIEDITTNKKYNLIEALANDIANNILKQFQLIDEVEITVKKPFAPIKQVLNMVSVTITKKRHTVYLSLGSNMGDRKNYLNTAINMLNDRSTTRVNKIASFIETKPYGNVNQDDFLNTAVEISTILEPNDLLKFINKIENDCGRVRKEHWGPRTLDIDIILYEDKVINTEKLIIPHKEMHLRKFVLEPLLEIAPNACHPVIGENIYQIYKSTVVK
jgi:dihydroneopterin aldolase/2-amino-4-hydroxy-6-hydroxymethyldihydropteridine diphosphokinase